MSLEYYWSKMSVNIKRINSPLQIHMLSKFWPGD